MYDSSGSAGTVGQVLSTTGSETNWVFNNRNSDNDGDTLIQLEKGTDDDTIRFDAAGNEILTANASDTFIYNDLTIGSSSSGLTGVGTSEVILTSANPSTGFEAYNAANVSTYNGNRTFGAIADLFNSTFETAAAAYNVRRITSGVDWGVGYSFSNTYNFTSIRLHNRPDCCSGRVAGGEIRIYNAGTLVASSTMVADPGTNAWTTAYTPNVIGDEVRYIFPNGANNTEGNDQLNFSEFEIIGQETETRGVQSLSITGSTTLGGALIDASGDAGTAGQVLSSTGTSTNWVNASVTNIRVVTGNYTLTGNDTTLIVKATGSGECK